MSTLAAHITDMGKAVCGSSSRSLTQATSDMKFTNREGHFKLSMSRDISTKPALVSSPPSLFQVSPISSLAPSLTELAHLAMLFNTADAHYSIVHQLAYKIYKEKLIKPASVIMDIDQI